MNSIQAQIESSKNEFKLSNIEKTNQSQEQVPAKNINIINSNGFSSPFTAHQLAPIVYALLMFIEFIIINVYFQDKIVQIVLIISYSCVIVIVFVLWLLTTIIDPTDTTQIMHKQAIQMKVDFNAHLYQYFCHVCQTCVSKNSFHCKKCNRCVDMFDHHCKWVNNCIGAKNYFQFLALVSSAEIMILFHFVFNCVNIAAQSKLFPSFQWVFYVEIVFIVVDFVILGFNSALLAIHFYLVVKKKTTLQLILERRKINKIYPSQKQQKQLTNQNSSNISSPAVQQIGSRIKQKQKEKQQGQAKQILKVQLKPLKKNIKNTYNLRSKIKSIRIEKNNCEN